MYAPLRRLYYFIKRHLLRSIKTAVLSLVLLVIVLGNVGPVFAQQELGNLKGFKELFVEGTSSSATLGFLKGFNSGQEVFGNDGTNLNSLNFVFNWSFNTATHDTAWHWDHVENFDKSNVFLVRICTAGANGQPDESTCRFARAPQYKRFDAGTCDGKDLDYVSNDGGEKCSTTNYEIPDRQLKPSPYVYSHATDVYQAVYKADGTFDYYSVIQREANVSGPFKGTQPSLTGKKSDAYTKSGGVKITIGNLSTLNQSTKKLEGTEYIKDTFKMGDTKTYTADLWYCALSSPSGEDPLPDASSYNNSDPSVRFFGNLCDGGDKPYIRVGKPGNNFLTFTVPAVGTASNYGTATQTTIAQSQSDTTSKGKLPECGVIMSGTLLGCLAQIVYYILFRPIAWFAGLLGNLFDFFVGYSVSDESYRADFAVNGWRIVRDVSNVFFIIIMVYTGFAAVFGIPGVNMKKVVTTLIINAILINFSLFGTRVVIDISNIFARIFYTRIRVCTTADCTPDESGKVQYKRNSFGYWPLSEAIVSSFNPQKILDASTLNTQTYQKSDATTDDVNFGTANPNEITANNKPLDENRFAAYFIIVSLIGAVIMFGIAKMFWTVGFIFLGRVIGLYLCMIFAPFAILTQGNIPILGKIDKIGWKSWKEELIAYATLAPIFLFFLYIIYFFLQSNFMKASGLDVNNATNFFETVIYIAIPMLIVYTLIDYGAKLAKTYSGDIGKRIDKWIDNTVGGFGGAVGLAAGAATGGAAFALRNTAGRGIAYAANHTKWGRSTRDYLARNAPNSRLARIGNNAINKAQTGSWDLRNLNLGKINGKDITAATALDKYVSTFGQEKVKYKASDALGLKQDKGKGGVKAIDKKRAENRQKANDSKINYDHLDKDQAKAVWNQYKEKEADKAANKNWEKHTEAIITELKSKVDSAKKTEDELKAKLDEAHNQADTRKIMQAENAYKAASTNRQNAENELNNQSTIIDGLKKDPSKLKESAAYKEARQEEKDRLDKFNVKDGKALTTAMRAEYGKKLFDNSWWLKDGKTKPENALLQGLGGIASLITGGFLGYGGAAYMLSELTDIAGGIRAKAAKASMNAADAIKKNKGKLAKLEAQFDAYNEEIEKAYKEYKKMDKKIDDMSEDDINEAISSKIVDIEDTISGLRNDLRNTTNPDMQKELRTKIAAEEMKKKKFEKMAENREKTKENMDKEKATQEEKEKKDGEKKDDKKEDKK